MKKEEDSDRSTSPYEGPRAEQKHPEDSKESIRRSRRAGLIVLLSLLMYGIFALPLSFGSPARPWDSLGVRLWILTMQGLTLAVCCLFTSGAIGLLLGRERAAVLQIIGFGLMVFQLGLGAVGLTFILPSDEETLFRFRRYQEQMEDEDSKRQPALPGG